jgi:Leucine-rich repeat (LRR) protein
MDENNLFKVDLGTLPALEKLELQKNLINEFKTSGLPALKQINMSNNYLTSLDLTSFKKLEEARLSDNPDMKKLEIWGLRSLKLLRCSPNNIINLNMSGTVSLQELEW